MQKMQHDAHLSCDFKDWWLSFFAKIKKKNAKESNIYHKLGIQVRFRITSSEQQLVHDVPL